MAVKIGLLAFLLCLMLLFPGAIYGQEIETKGIVSDIIGTFESKASGGYEAYQNIDSGVVSYGKYQFTAIYGTEGSLYAVLKRYAELSQSSTSKEIYENYVKKHKSLEGFRNIEKR